MKSASIGKAKRPAAKRKPARKTRTDIKRARHDWRRFDAMTDEEVMAAAKSDPDAQPLTDEQLKRMQRIPFAKHLRWKLGLSQQEFAERFQIPIGTLRDWEQGRVEPDRPARAYLKVIANNPAAVDDALPAVKHARLQLELSEKLARMMDEMRHMGIDKVPVSFEHRQELAERLAQRMSKPTESKRSDRPAATKR